MEISNLHTLLTLVPSMFFLAHPHLLPYSNQEFNITLLYYYRIWVMYRTKVQQLTQITQTRHQKDGKKLVVIILIRKMMHLPLCMCKSKFPCTNMLHIIQIFWIYIIQIWIFLQGLTYGFALLPICAKRGQVTFVYN